ncbi:MAG: N-formylglutamate amidohydrolase [Pseudomonadota bacterium]
MSGPAIVVHGPRPPAPPRSSLVLDSPHSGRVLPLDFGAAVAPEALREGEDCFIDELYLPAAGLGIPLLAAQFPRTYLDANRHADDIDPELLDEPWPGPLAPSGKAGIGKALVWRTLDRDRPIYDRRLTVAEVRRRIDTCHRPYHEALAGLIDAAHARFGVVHHLNCHSMGATTSVAIEGVAGRPRPDMVLGDRDGTTCAPEFTAFAHRFLADLGYDVRINDPFKGVELVRAWSDPAAGRHSLQLEINKRLYMDEQPAIARHAGFERLQGHLMALLAALDERFTPREAHRG